VGRADSVLRGRVAFVAGRPEEAVWLAGLLGSHPRAAAAPLFDVFEHGVERLFDNLEGRDPDLHGLIRFAERDELVDAVRALCDALLLSACDQAPERLVVPVPASTGLPAQRRRDVFPDAWHLEAGDPGALLAEIGLDPRDARLRDAPPMPGAAMTRDALRTAPRRAARRARSVLRRWAARRPGPGEELATLLVLGLHHRDEERLRSIAHPALELVVRTPDGDHLHEGAEAHRALAQLGDALFGRRHVGEWWGGSGGSGDWWTSAPGRPLRTVFFSALGGDATRTDVAVAIEPGDDRIRRLVVVAAGPLAGRPILRD
jgi:hypothetical protein